MKGGKVCEVISGKRIGKFAQIPNALQKQEFLDIKKVFAEYYEDSLGQHPVTEDGNPVSSLTSISNLKIIGFYD